MKKAVIFDFDYTLGDSSKGIALSINYALAQLGYSERGLPEIKKTIGLSLKDTYEVLTGQENQVEAEQFAKLFKRKADEVMVANTLLYDSVKDVLQKLKSKGFRIGIVTTKFHYRIEQILSRFDANDLVDLIVGGDDVKIEKPNPEGLLWAIAALKGNREEVFYVGDSIVDAQTAKNAEVEFIGVLTGTTTQADFEEYDKRYIGKNISDVYGFIVEGVKNIQK